MVGGGGSIANMLTTLRNNAALLTKRGSMLYNNKELRYTLAKRKYEEASKGILLKKASPEQLKQIREKIITKRKAEKKRNLLIMILLIPVAIYMAYDISKNVLQSNSFNEKEVSDYHTEKIKKLNYYISDGDYWLKRKHWNNAIFQYKKAVQLFPRNYEVNQKLAAAYNDKCRNTEEDCEIAGKFERSLWLKFPFEIAPLAQ